MKVVGTLVVLVLVCFVYEASAAAPSPKCDECQKVTVLVEASVKRIGNQATIKALTGDKFCDDPLCLKAVKVLAPVLEAAINAGPKEIASVCDAINAC